MRRIRQFIAGFLCLATLVVYAAASNPVTMLQNMTDQLISALKKNESKLKSQPTFVYGLVNKILLPHVDTVVMSQSVLGRNGWMKATPAQRKTFTKEFTQTVVRTYASALNAYTNETVRYLPLRGGYQGKQVIQVNSQIVRPNGPAVPITYSLISRSNVWKVFDLNVEGISLLQSFRSQISAQLSRGESVAQIIAGLETHNSKIRKPKS